MVTLKAEAALAKRAAFGGVSPSARATANAPQNVSPAAVVVYGRDWKSGDYLRKIVRKNERALRAKRENDEFWAASPQILRRQRDMLRCFDGDPGQGLPLPFH